jgi:flagellar biosynthesis activator protein FlaF
MANPTDAIQAYRAASRYRSQRDQEADVFRQAIAGLRSSQGIEQIQQVRALADNRRLWMMVTNLMTDPDNVLPDPLKARIVAVGRSVQREMEQEKPDLDFLIAINESIAAGLAGQP